MLPQSGTELVTTSPVVPRTVTRLITGNAPRPLSIITSILSPANLHNSAPHLQLSASPSGWKAAVHTILSTSTFLGRIHFRIVQRRVCREISLILSTNVTSWRQRLRMPFEYPLRVFSMHVVIVKNIGHRVPTNSFHKVCRMFNRLALIFCLDLECADLLPSTLGPSCRTSQENCNCPAHYNR